MNNTYKALIALSTFLFIAAPLLAQGGPPATPVDGGLSFLLAAAGAYGVKKLMDKKK